jgi:hypothetical protein
MVILMASTQLSDPELSILGIPGNCTSQVASKLQNPTFRCLCCDKPLTVAANTHLRILSEVSTLVKTMTKEICTHLAGADSNTSQSRVRSHGIRVCEFCVLW